MGRGRKKAKATKIARELNYTDPGTDLARLQAELNADHACTNDDELEGPNEDAPTA